MINKGLSNKTGLLGGDKTAGGLTCWELLSEPAFKSLA